MSVAINRVIPVGCFFFRVKLRDNKVISIAKDVKSVAQTTTLVETVAGTRNSRIRLMQYKDRLWSRAPVILARRTS